MVKFFIKAFFWIGLFIVILPGAPTVSQSPSSQTFEEQADQASVTVFSYLIDFCTHKPIWCEKIHDAGVKAYNDLTSLLGGTQFPDARQQLSSTQL